MGISLICGLHLILYVVILSEACSSTVCFPTQNSDRTVQRKYSTSLSCRAILSSISRTWFQNPNSLFAPLLPPSDPRTLTPHSIELLNYELSGNCFVQYNNDSWCYCTSYVLYCIPYYTIPYRTVPYGILCFL